MVSAFSMLGIALDYQGDMAQTAKIVATADLNKQLEDFTIQIYTDSNQLISVDVKNKGQNAVQIPTLIITNSSDYANGFPVTVYDIPSNTMFVGPGRIGNVVSTTPITLGLAQANATELYHFKVISSLGTIKTTSLICDDTTCGTTETPAGSGSLSESLFLDGPNGINTKTSTVIMFVTNTSQEIVTDVEPFKGFAGNDDCDTNDFWQVDVSGVTVDNGITESITNCSVTPIGSVIMGGHEVAIYKWDFTVGGDIGAVFTFCNYVTGTDPIPDSINSLPESCDTLEIIDPNDCDGCGPGGGEGGETIILIDDLLIKPSLFLTLPSPFGGTPSNSDNDIGLWGVQVVNPLNFTISISKVTITAFAPGANSNLKVFDPLGNSENVSPGTPGLGMGDWYPNSENVLAWKNFANPIVLGPYQSETFMVKIQPESVGTDLEAVIVQTSIFSSAGSFGKSGYQTTIYDGTAPQDSPIINVYMSSVVDSTDIHLGHINNMTNGTSQDFIIVMADMDTNDESYIAAGTEFIINVPREWELPVIIPTDTTKIIQNATEPQIIAHSDGSYQIIGLLSENIGDVEANEATTISFSTVPPEKEVERLYIMYVLGNGLTNNPANSVGPLSEIILHVIGNVTGYP